jgi:uncharacterized protein with GYD domain
MPAETVAPLPQPPAAAAAAPAPAKRGAGNAASAAPEAAGAKRQRLAGFRACPAALGAPAAAGGETSSSRGDVLRRALAAIGAADPAQQAALGQMYDLLAMCDAPADVNLVRTSIQDEDALKAVVLFLRTRGAFVPARLEFQLTRG